jgi:hypothetical protein
MRPPQFRMKILTALAWLLLLVPTVQGQSTVLITLDQAIDLALAHSQGHPHAYSFRTSTI